MNSIANNLYNTLVNITSDPYKPLLLEKWVYITNASDNSYVTLDSNGKNVSFQHKKEIMQEGTEFCLSPAHSQSCEQPNKTLEDSSIKLALDRDPQVDLTPVQQRRHPKKEEAHSTWRGIHASYLEAIRHKDQGGLKFMATMPTTSELLRGTVSQGTYFGFNDHKQAELKCVEGRVMLSINSSKKSGKEYFLPENISMDTTENNTVKIQLSKETITFKTHTHMEALIWTRSIKYILSISNLLALQANQQKTRAQLDEIYARMSERDGQMQSPEDALNNMRDLLSTGWNKNAPMRCVIKVRDHRIDEDRPAWVGVVDGYWVVVDNISKAYQFDVHVSHGFPPSNSVTSMLPWPTNQSDVVYFETKGEFLRRTVKGCAGQGGRTKDIAQQMILREEIL